MALQVLSKRLACQGCQKLVLRSFIAACASPATLQQISSLSQKRNFVKTARRWNDGRDDAAIQEHASNNATDGASRDSARESTPPREQSITDENLPWYLRVQQPLPPPSPLSSRQRIPDLPSHSPELLEPLMQHVSVDLGMDDLSLLDLRELDPPPALGANLFMLIGTARSEKHLHVSADRLCRWLRTTYKLSPYADGLLGRNELKLKLRRKAKRSRLLSAVGTKETADTDIDDGIRTGWVCVNVGRVPGGELPAGDGAVEARKEIIGFSAISGGSNIVVQLMTDEKRGEIDLERLWTDVLNHPKRKKIAFSNEERVVDSTTSAASASHLTETDREPFGQPATTDSGSQARYVSSIPASGSGQQLRAYSTSTRRLHPTASRATARDAASWDSTVSQESPLSALPTTDPSLAALEQQLASLKRMPQNQALASMGYDFLSVPRQLTLDDTGPDTAHGIQIEAPEQPFVANFYSAMPAFPGPEHWHLHLELLAYARQLGHVNAHSTVLAAQLKNMQLAALMPEERTFKLVIQAMLAPMGKSGSYNGDESFPSDGKMWRVLSTLEDMEACGYDPVSSEILELLSRACVGPGTPSLEHESPLASIVAALGVARLRRHVRENDWTAFWRTWTSYPQRFLSRTAEMYSVLFQAVRDGKVQDMREARDVMRTALAEMDVEEPRILLSQHPVVASILRQALEFVDPLLAETNGERTGSGEWRAWYLQARKQSTD